MCVTERISYGFQDLESYSATISVFIILNKGVSVRDGQPKFVSGTNILLKNIFFVMLIVIILCAKRVMIILMRNDLLSLTR